MKIKFEDTPVENLQIVPVGVYQIKIIDGEEGVWHKQTKNQGEPYLKVIAGIADKNGAVVSKPDDLLFFTANSKWRYESFARAANLGDGKKIEKGQEVDYSLSNIIGRRAYAKVGIRRYTDKKTNEEKEVNCIVDWLEKDLLPRDEGFAKQFTQRKAEEDAYADQFANNQADPFAPQQDSSGETPRFSAPSDQEYVSHF